MARDHYATGVVRGEGAALTFVIIEVQLLWNTHHDVCSGAVHTFQSQLHFWKDSDKEILITVPCGWSD